MRVDWIEFSISICFSSFYSVWMCHMDRAVFTFCGRRAVRAFTWPQPDPMEALPFTIDRDNCKIASFYKRKYYSRVVLAVGRKSLRYCLCVLPQIVFRLCMGQWRWFVGNYHIQFVTGKIEFHSQQIVLRRYGFMLRHMTQLKWKSICKLYVCVFVFVTHHTHTGNYLGHKYTTKAYHWYRFTGSIDMYFVGEIIATDGRGNGSRQFSHLQSSNNQVRHTHTIAHADQDEFTRKLFFFSPVADAYQFWVNTRNV